MTASMPSCSRTRRHCASLVRDDFRACGESNLQRHEIALEEPTEAEIERRRRLADG
jgi:hypothetical protein